MTDITIPPQVRKAVGEVLFKYTCIHVGAETIDDACLAMLRAWPGMRVKAVLLADTVLLPLPQETSA